MSPTWSGAGRRPKGIVVCPICQERVSTTTTESTMVNVGDIEVADAPEPTPARLYAHNACFEQLTAILRYLRPRPAAPFDPVLLKRVKRAIATAKKKG